MRISFSMDGIRDINQLYTYTTSCHPESGCIRSEHYHGDDYCKSVITDVLNSLTSSDWIEKNYLGSCNRIGNETFALLSTDMSKYDISFDISTYNGDAARLEITISAPETVSYDHRLEKLKIALKNRLLPDWYQCTWLSDEQAATLCKYAYEKTFAIENNLRAFASKVLIHFLGVDWIKRAGLEKEAESVNTLMKKFIQRVPDFDNINTDFLSMTLETLVNVMFKGITYKDDIILSRQSYEKIQSLGAKRKTTGANMADYIKSLRSVDKRIWDDLFIPYIDNPNDFKTAVHAFIENRNHIAHSKVLSWSAYKIILQDFEKFDSLILSAILDFEHKETADEVIQTWQVEQKNDEYQQQYYRDRLANETGMDILNEDEIRDWFEEILYELFDLVYQRYHLDVCYEISNLTTLNKDKSIFTISCPAIEDGSAKLDIIAEYSIDDDLGEDSFCYIIAKDGTDRELSKAEIRFHNGNGHENENGSMEPTDSSEYDTSELDSFRNDLLTTIESLNPYPKKLDRLSYENKNALQFIAEFPCSQCGKFGISINEAFLSIGRCCYCGHENKLEKCIRCDESVPVDFLSNGFCPACTAYIEKQ